MFILNGYFTCMLFFELYKYKHGNNEIVVVMENIETGLQAGGFKLGLHKSIWWRAQALVVLVPARPFKSWYISRLAHKWPGQARPGHSLACMALPLKLTGSLQKRSL